MDNINLFNCLKIDGPIIYIDVVGLKCDAPDCDYRNDTAKVQDYAKYLDAPCPKCGAPLLTLADLIAVYSMYDRIHRINMFAEKWLPKWLLRLLHNPKKGVAKMNGSGEIKVEWNKS